MIARPLYLDILTSLIDQPFIKILVGIRRAGKSTLLDQIEKTLLNRNISPDKIIHINFDTLEYTDIRDKKTFLNLVKTHLKSGKHYFLFDEIQDIEGWEEVISALYAEKNTDIYITGSNSKLLSSELSTFLTGRFIRIPVNTLNFREFIDFKKAYSKTEQKIDQAFDEFSKKGGFPAIHLSDQPLNYCDDIIRDIYSSIVLHDLVERKRVRNTELLSRIIKYIFDNIGNTFSAKSITDFLKNEKRPLTPESVYNYLDWLEEAFVIHKVSRYDIRGKAHLKTNEKYYLGDIGMLYAINGRSDTYLPGILENIVYHELISHKYTVSIGKNGDKEIDFIAEKDGQKLYLQVTTHLNDETTVEREFGAFDGINDNYPKYILTLDKEHKIGPHEKNGIKEIYLPKFILENLG